MGRLTRNSEGTHDHSKWLQEGDGLLASAKAVRNLWEEHGIDFGAKLAARQTDPEDISLNRGLPRASMLLIGYAVEMFLKAGVVKAYIGCPSENFDKDIKCIYGHKYVATASEIDFELKGNDRDHFTTLSKVVTNDARYPVEVTDGKPYWESINENTAAIWSKYNFESFHDLAKRVRHHSESIDACVKCPAHTASYTIDETGFLALRIGGHLRPRVTYRTSSKMISDKKTSIADIKGLIESIDSVLSDYILLDWHSIRLIEYKQNGKRTEHSVS